MKLHYLLICLATVAIVATGCAGYPAGPGATPDGDEGRPVTAQSQDADDFLVVDCLLPGQVRRLGSMIYHTPRRPIKTTALDCRIRGGEYVAYDRGSYKASINVWRPRAEEGDKIAQTYMGEIYLRGVGGAPRYDLAAEWFRRAAEQGHPRAQINMGYLFENGLGVTKDPQAALTWYRKATGEEIDAIKSATDTTVTGPDERQTESDTETSVGRDTGRMPPEGSREGSETAGTEGPFIEVIDPKPMAVRGARIVPAQNEATQRLVVGRVRAPAGLFSFTVNGANEKPDNSGMFKVSVPVAPEKTTPVILVAVDNRGRRAKISFSIVPEAEGGGDKSRGYYADRVDLSFGKYHALIIGNDAYQHLTPLKTAVNDARILAKILRTRYGFETTVLTNATRYEMHRALDTFRKRVTEKENFLLYYAGHGELDQNNRRGYWLPVDAVPDSYVNAIPNFTVTDILNNMSARQVIIIADTCYSGILTRSVVSEQRGGMSDEKRLEWLKTLAEGRSRTVLSSGGVKPVLDIGGGDHSVFAGALIDVLSNNDGILQASILHKKVGVQVSHASVRLGLKQVPQYAASILAGHESGDFLFVPKGFRPGTHLSSR